MKFSILVPVYNVEKYLEDCLQSLIRQPFSDYEVILVDDGSTDRSGMICDQYAQKYSHIRVIHKKNQGLISARRVGISEAHGEFCVFVDSDDYVHLSLLHTLNESIEKYPDADLFLYSFQYDRGGVIQPRKIQVAQDGTVWTGEEKKQLYLKLIQSAEITSIWTKAIRTSVLQSDPTDYSIYYGKNMAEDLLQSLYPVTAAQKVVYVDQALYNYRINSDSFTQTFYPDTIQKKDTLHVYRKILEYLPIWELDTEEMRQRLRARWFHETMYLFCQYYEGVKTKQERLQILRADWSSMLPEESREIRNQYESPIYQRLYFQWKNGKWTAIRLYFLQKSFYKKMKRLKSKMAMKRGSL